MNNDTPTESLVTPPRTVQRAANDLAFVAPERLAAKLRAYGYQVPALPLARKCIADGCTNLTYTVVCMECQIQSEIAALRAEERKPVPWHKVLLGLAVASAAILAVAFMVLK